MATKSTNGRRATGQSKKSVETLKPNEKGDVSPKAKCSAIATEGIRTGSDFAKLMSAMMTDLITGDISAQRANAVISSGNSLLRVVTLQHRYGKPENSGFQLLK